MKTITSICVSLLSLCSAQAQVGGAPQVTTTQPVPAVFEPYPILSARTILKSVFDRGANFHVHDAVPTYAGANAFTVNSDFGVFKADGNEMLMRRVSEINAIAVLHSISATKQFGEAAKKAAQSPLLVAKELVTNPVGTVSGVPKGVWKFLNSAGQTVKEVAQGRQGDANEGNIATNLIGFSKVKRGLALQLGVDPYSTNEVFQEALNHVAWPTFAGGFTVDIGMAVATAGLGNAGLAIKAVNWTGNFNEILREKGPADLRLYNLGILLEMGITREQADAFLNNTSLSPSAQTILVGNLAQLGGASGRDGFLRLAATSGDETDALFYQQCAQLMVLVNATTPIASIGQLNGITVCQTSSGGVVVPIQWDYVAWTPQTARFVTALKSLSPGKPATSYSVVLTGVVSPMTAHNLTAVGVTFAEKQLPGPLK
jgi:hypothetical protein